MKGDNWTKDYLADCKEESLETLKKVKEKRKGKKFRMVKISSTPPTWIEEEIL